MTSLAALQATLRTEHAALYVYGALGARTSQTGAPALFAAISAAYTEHRARRDLLTREIRDLGATPVAAEPVYALPDGIGSPTGVERAALALERGCATTYAATVAGTLGPRRRWAIAALTDAAVRQLSFDGRPQRLPGG